MQDDSQSPEVGRQEETEDGAGLARQPNSADPSDEEVSAVLVEVAPGVVAAYGDLASDLGLEPLDLTLIPSDDREMVTSALAGLGNAATVAGNLVNAAAKSQGLFRIADASLAQMAKTGGTLAVKDGANLGAIIIPGGRLAQARFVPVSAAGVGTLAASAGPALAMIVLQASLNQLNDLTRTNIALTSQILVEARQESWSELTGLVKKIQDTTARAREAKAVTENLWSTVAGKGADLEAQRDRYRRKVSDHVKALAKRAGRAQREYLESNADAIAFDSFALFSSLKAWVGYQALFAAREAASGPADSPEARVAEAILADTRTEFGLALAEITNLVEALSRELQLVAQLPGRSTLPGTKRRKDVEAARAASQQLLQAIKPLTEHLVPPPAPEAREAGVLCLPEGADQKNHLKVLQLHLEREENLRAVGLVYEFFDHGPILDKTTMVAVTDRRVLSSPSKLFLRTGELSREMPIDEVRYVRLTARNNGSPRSRIDVITKKLNLRWEFSPDIPTKQIAGLASILAESMTIPESERADLIKLRTTLATTATSESSSSDKGTTG